jgi:hypothetical protein
MERWRGPDRLEIVADELGPSLRCAAPEITPRYHRPDTIMLLGVAGSPWDEPRAPETTGRTRETSKIRWNTPDRGSTRVAGRAVCT